jgi:hypothetical protein
VGVEAKVTSASATPGHSVTQRDRSCAGKTTERGTETRLIGCREAVITNVARFRAPADPSCESGGIGSENGQNPEANRLAGRSMLRHKGIRGD